MTNELTAEEIAVLKNGGFDLEAYPGDDPFYATARELVDLIRTSLSVDVAALRLGVPLTDFQHMIEERTVYAVPSTSGWLIPAFQFDGDRLVHGIEAINPCVSDDLSLVEVYRWFTLPDPELELDGHVWTPLEWLRNGMPPDAIAISATNLSTYHGDELQSDAKLIQPRTLADLFQINDETPPVDLEGSEIPMGTPAQKLIEI